MLRAALRLAILLGVTAALSCSRQTTPNEITPPAPAELRPFIISGDSGPAGVVGKDALKERIAREIHRASDLPRYYSSTVFRNPRIAEMEFGPDSVIADIGSGTGALEVALLLSGKPFKKIYAVDITVSALEIAKFVIDRYFPESAEKIEYVTSHLDDVMLPQGSVDLAILSDAHFFVPKLAGSEENLRTAVRCLATLRAALKPGGRVRAFQNSPWGSNPQPKPDVIKPGPPDPSRDAQVKNGEGVGHDAPDRVFLEAQLQEIGESFTAAGFTIDAQSVDDACRCYSYTLTAGEASLSGADVFASPEAVPVILIPAGKFLLGCKNRQDPQCHGHHESIDLPGFFIDKYEVLMTHYDRCVAAGACTNVPKELHSPGDRYPASGADRKQAADYCRWLGKRLPTSAEWEKAARGTTDSRRYPWGDRWDPKAANFCDGADCDGSVDGFKKWAPVDAFRQGESPYGARQMAGNQLEWTSTNVKFDGNDFAVIRGGSWGGHHVGGMAKPEYGLIAWNQLSDPPDIQAEHIGFRCAKDDRL